MTQVDLSMKSLEKFSDDLERYTGNLSRTAGVFEEIVAPVAKESGSDLLIGVAQDVSDIKEEFGAKAVTAKRSSEGLKEYTSRLNKINSL